jgi:hypothetical protein
MPARGREETANEASRPLTKDEATSETARVSGARNLSSWSAGCDQRACGENERSPRLIDVTSRDAPAVRWCARTWCADARVPTFESLQRVLSWLSAFPSRSARWRAAPRSSIEQSKVFRCIAHAPRGCVERLASPFTSAHRQGTSRDRPCARLRPRPTAARRLARLARRAGRRFRRAAMAAAIAFLGTTRTPPDPAPPAPPPTGSIHTL